MSSATSTSSLPSGLAVLTTFPDVLFIPEIVSVTFSLGRADAACGASSRLHAAGTGGMRPDTKHVAQEPRRVPEPPGELGAAPDAWLTHKENPSGAEDTEALLSSAGDFCGASENLL